MLQIGTSLSGWTNAVNIVLGHLSNIPSWVIGNPQMTALYFCAEILAAVIGLLAIILCWRKYPAAAAFSAAAWVIAVTSGFPQSNIRYMLVLPVIFLMLSRAGKNPVFDRVWTLASVLLMGLLATLYTFDFWVA